MESEYLLFLILHLAGLTIRNIYEALKNSGKVDSRNRLVFAVVFGAMCLMWAGWFEMCTMDPLKIRLPAFVHFAGLLLVVVGFILAVVSLIHWSPASAKRTAGIAKAHGCDWVRQSLRRIPR